MTASAPANQAAAWPAAARRSATRAGQAGRSPSRLVTLGALALIGVVGFTSLGVWQCERRAWKLDLIDRVEQRIHADPVPIPQRSMWSWVNARDDAYKRVSVAGRFLHDRETLIRAVTERGGGFWVLTPLQADDGFTVLVNRGFVPPERRDPAARGEGNPQGHVHVTGLMRMTEPHGAFLRNNDPGADRWYSRDVAAITAARGLAGIAPFFVDADARPNPGGWPLGGLTVVAFPNNHLIYALTWFALALMVGGAGVFVARDEWRCRKRDLHSSPSLVPK